MIIGYSIELGHLGLAWPEVHDTPGQHALNCYDATGDYAIMFTVLDN